MSSRQKTKQHLLDLLDNKEIVVWGARMTGIGFSRFFEVNTSKKIHSFIDSDTSLHHKTINGITIHAPESLKALKLKYPNLLIVVAVALKEKDIIKNMDALGFNEKDYILYSHYCKDFYTIDVVGTCNLKCPSCAHGAIDMASPLGFMSYDNFVQVVQKALKESEVVSHVSLYSWGEPLLHKDLPKMVEYLHEHGIAVAISSNLSIRDIDAIDKMIKAEPDYLKISTSGFYEDAYNDTHTGGNVHLVKSNLYRIKYLIDKLNLATLIDVNYHLYNNNCGENLKKMEVLCAELDFSLSTTYALIMPLERVVSYCDGYAGEDVLQLNDKLLVNIEEGIEASSVITIDECPFRENQININWDLSVPVCCTVFNRNQDTIVANNYLDISLNELNANKQQVSLCKKCMELRLPEYNMGFNQTRWKEIANSKKCVDLNESM